MFQKKWVLVRSLADQFEFRSGLFCVRPRTIRDITAPPSASFGERVLRCRLIKGSGNMPDHARISSAQMVGFNNRFRSIARITTWPGRRQSNWSTAIMSSFGSVPES